MRSLEKWENILQKQKKHLRVFTDWNIKKLFVRKIKTFSPLNVTFD